MGTAVALWLGAVGLHAGFQLTVTTLAYPALADHDAADWSAAHERHSRRITPLVGVVYLVLLLAGAGLVTTDPGPPTAVAVAPVAGALLVTAVGAAPLHGQLSAHDPALVTRLLRVDRVRCALAVLALVPALVLVLE